jgi:hypothetical protein
MFGVWNYYYYCKQLWKLYIQHSLLNRLLSWYLELNVILETWYFLFFLCNDYIPDRYLYVLRQIIFEAKEYFIFCRILFCRTCFVSTSSSCPTTQVHIKLHSMWTQMWKERQYNKCVLTIYLLLSSTLRILIQWPKCPLAIYEHSVNEKENHNLARIWLHTKFMLFTPKHFFGFLKFRKL